MSLVRSVVGGLRALFRKEQLEREMDEELRGYLDAAVKEKMRSGMGQEAALRAARVEMGSTEAVKEEIRSAGWEARLELLWQDLRYGVRMLRKGPGFTAVAILTLALGIGANTAIFSLIDTVMLRMLPVPKPEELMQVRIIDPRWAGRTGGSFTNSLWEQLRDRQDVFSGVFAWGEDQFDLAQGGAVHYAQGIWASGDFFNTLQLRPAAGRLIAPSDDQRGCAGAAVLSYGFWQNHYGGSTSAIGSTLSLNNHSFEVIGVAPPGFYGMNVGGKFDVAVPICAAAMFDGNDSRIDDRGWWWLAVVGRIKPGVSQAQLTARLKVLSPQVFTAALPQNGDDIKKGFLKKAFVAVPAAKGTSSTGTSLRQQFDQPLNILMAVVGLVLLIACANIASLMLARAAARHKEIAVRQALGASRTRLIRQLLTECVLLSSAGALVGVFFARWGTALLVRYISTAKNQVFLDLSVDSHVLGFTAGVGVLTGILFGLLPALRSTGVSLTAAMKGSQAAEGGRFLAGKWIVALQVALSLVLLVAAGLLLRSFAKLETLDIGFDRDNVLLVNADLKVAKVPPDQQLTTYEAIESRLSALPGVVSAGRSVITVIEGGAWNKSISTDWSKAVTGDDALVWFNSVSPGYFETLRIPLLVGRNFDNRDTKTAPKVAIVNQTLARRFFPNLNPIGKTFRMGQISGQSGPLVEVVGVMRDSKYESVREETHPTAYFPAAQFPPAYVFAQTFELRTAVTPPAMILAVQAAVAGVNKQIPIDFHTLAERVDDSLVPERTLALLSAFFGALALLLAMIGLYGTLSYLVTRRHAEFGIRMALGAPRGSILRLVMYDVVVVLGGGLAAGGCISLATTRLLQQMLFGLGARDTATIAFAVAVLSAVAMVASYLPARRATKVDPMVALRYE